MVEEKQVSVQVWQFSNMKLFVCHQVAFMEKFCGRIGQVIVIYRPILCYTYTPALLLVLQPHQQASKMAAADSADSQKKEFKQRPCCHSETKFILHPIVKPFRDRLQVNWQYTLTLPTSVIVFFLSENSTQYSSNSFCQCF